LGRMCASMPQAPPTPAIPLPHATSMQFPTNAITMLLSQSLRHWALLHLAAPHEIGYCIPPHCSTATHPSACCLTSPAPPTYNSSSCHHPPTQHTGWVPLQAPDHSAPSSALQAGCSGCLMLRLSWPSAQLPKSNTLKPGVAAGSVCRSCSSRPAAKLVAASCPSCTSCSSSSCKCGACAM
jgi:hypothetical protein